MSKKILTPEEIKTREEITRAKNKLWRVGNLEFKLKGVQKEIKTYLKENPDQISVILSSRRLGKSTILICYAIEEAIKNPGAVIKYSCPEQVMIQRNLNPMFVQLLEDCPVDVKPRWNESQKSWMFQNGSQIQIAGTDGGNIEKLRGASAILCICDEAGFMDSLNYVVYSVMAPLTDIVIGPNGEQKTGKIVLASTPNPKEPNHEFHKDFVFPRKATEELKVYTVYDSPLLSEKEINKIINRYPAGVDDPAFRCEYLCEISTESSSLVIPEFNESTRKDIIRETELPAYYHAYVSGDPAVVDLTGILFAYNDFLRNKLVIVDELVLGGEGFSDVTTDDIASGIKRKESLYFYNPLTKERIEPKMRVMDNSHKLLINDLHKEHGLSFFPTAKDQKDLQINKLRMMIKNGQIEINPRCKNLIFHLSSAQWDKNKTGFQRVKSQGEFRAHHADLVDALLYLVRNIDLQSNPYPDGYFERNDYGNTWGLGRGKDNSVYKSIKSILNIRR
jgi:hypothetical protein